jgi:hypothetical protein
MKRQQAIEKIVAFATEFGASVHIILPKTWLKQRIVAMTKERYDQLREKGRVVIGEGRDRDA